MENIVIPVSLAPSQARAPDTGPPGGAEMAGGLFGSLLLAQLAKTDSSNGLGKKTADNGTNPMAALLISALMQGSIFAQVTTDTQGTTETSQQDSSGTAQIAGTGTQALTALMTLADAKGVAGLRQALDGNPQFFEELKAMLTQASTGKGSSELAHLMAGLKGKVLGNLLAEAAGSESAEPVSQGNPKALEEIRKLFAELLSSGQPAPEAQPQTGAPPQAAGETAENLAADGTAPVQAAPVQAEPVGIAGEGAGDQASTDEGQSPQPEKAKANSAPDKSAKSGWKDDAVDFGFVLKAVHGRETSAAASQGAKEGRPEALTAQQAFDNIVDKITSMQSASQKEMEISLKPEFLGKVVIKLTMDEGALVAKITASNPKVQEAFLNQASALQGALADQGLKDVRFVVTSTNVPDASLQQQAERRGQERRDQNRRAAVAVDAAEERPAHTAISAYEQPYHSGKINYLA